MKYTLFATYVLDQSDDQVEWVRLFPDDMKIMSGKGVYRDDVLVLLFPQSIDTITNLQGLRDDLEIESLPVWNKTKYLLHMGNANQGYPVQEAVATSDGRQLEREEILDLVDRIESVFQ